MTVLSPGGVPSDAHKVRGKALCVGNCHVFLGSSSVCTCEAEKAAQLIGNYYPHFPPRPPTPPTAGQDKAPTVPLSRLRAAERAGASWLSADGMRAYCERYGAVLQADWDGTAFGSWFTYSAGLPADAVPLQGPAGLVRL
jgi:hypothetical protein